MNGRNFIDAPIAEESLWGELATNPDGDSPDLESIRVVCGGCRRVFRSFVHPHTPVMAKYECRDCGYTTEIQTRDKAMDRLEEHIEEGEYEEKLAKRASVNLLGLSGIPKRTRPLKLTKGVSVKVGGKIMPATLID